MARNVVHPFKIHVPDESLVQLRQKLQLASFPPSQGSFSDDEKYGASLSAVERLSKHWADGFDWRAQEARLNELMPQFTTTVEVPGFDDLTIHFVHQRGRSPDSIPLLFCHGWPGSFLEVIKILPLMTDPSTGPSFHVVAPSLPNFGFSDRVDQPGFTICHYAQAMHQVMLNLGYTKYVTQGGDWGFMITRSMTSQFPESCLASHVNMQLVIPSMLNGARLVLSYIFGRFTEQERQGMSRIGWYLRESCGYCVQQSTRPHTLGFSLADSPVGLLAWIYEKLREWTDDYAWTDDEILTWVSIYQFSKAGPAASLVIYHEARHFQASETSKLFRYIPVPLGISCFPQDVFPLPIWLSKTLGPLVFHKIHDAGGHFASYEKPKDLVADVQTMFGEGGGAYEIAEKLRAVSAESTQ